MLPKQVPLHDALGNTLEVRIEHALAHGCVRTLSMHAPYWVVNHTGLPLRIRELGVKNAGFCGDEAKVVRVPNATVRIRLLYPTPE